MDDRDCDMEDASDDRTLGAAAPRDPMEQSMSMTPLASLIVIGYHGTGSGESNPMVLVAFLGAVTTVAWVFFSRLRWRNTVMVAVAGWLVGLVLTFGF